MIQGFLSKQSKFAKNVLTLITGTGVAQLIPILITPILTRIYTPAQLGELATFVSATIILTNVATFRYEQAIVLPKQKKEAFKLFFFCLISSLIFSLTALLLIIIWGSINPFEEASILYLLPFGIITNAIFLASTNLANRNQSYRNMAGSKISENMVSAGIQLAGGFWILTSGVTLILGKVLGTTAGNSILLRKIFIARNYKYSKLILKPKELFQTAKKYKEFFFYSFPNSFLNVASNQMPLIILPALFSLNIAGFYSFSHRIVQGPMGIIISSFSQVFYQKANELKGSPVELHSFVKKAFKRSFIFGILPYTFLFLSAPIIFKIIFGESWEIAGEYTQYLVPWFFMVFLNSPLTPLTLVLNKQKEYLKYEATLFTARLLVFIIGWSFELPPEQVILFYGIVGFMFHLYLSYFLLNLPLRKPESRPQSNSNN